MKSQRNFLSAFFFDFNAFFGILIVAFCAFVVFAIATITTNSLTNGLMWMVGVAVLIGLVAGVQQLIINVRRETAAEAAEKPATSETVFKKLVRRDATSEIKSGESLGWWKEIAWPWLRQNWKDCALAAIFIGAVWNYIHPIAAAMAAIGIAGYAFRHTLKGWWTAFQNWLNTPSEKPAQHSNPAATNLAPKANFHFWYVGCMFLTCFTMGMASMLAATIIVWVAFGAFWAVVAAWGAHFLIFQNRRIADLERRMAALESTARISVTD